MNNVKQTKKDIRKARMEMNFFLLTAKTFKNTSMGLNYLGLAAPVLGMVGGCTSNAHGSSFANGFGGMLVGVMGLFICAIGAQETNKMKNQALRYYVDARNRLATLDPKFQNKKTR